MRRVRVCTVRNTDAYALVYGDDPRACYFEANRFIHLELTFRIDFPQGWCTQNPARAVVAGSPAQDALMLVPGAPYRRRPMHSSRSKCLSAARVGAPTVNGLPAMSGTFEARSGETRLGGLATSVAMDGRTYRLLAYTPVAQHAAYEQTFRSAMNSFVRLTNAPALERQPRRL